ncbi:hypothetical protein BAY61_08645 [Prauserella marina]|uniref:Uncharacterized protein n=1 Tax=Prauserella marina TaxID=530584 RepID=A0A222VM98_9PSEU|nr:hypothetical protein [Prauserella marina]ASR35035.1 hypothetical protein BAY61_08645 [Prauserella marina]PWV85227.1 hypothetical protein DES30_1011251 [Prauserella marina]SDC01914.1 hypothetical protein SAMN05421630_10187 [Prauserella marina]
MPTEAVITIAVLGAILVVTITLLFRQHRVSTRLRERFGPEYDRALEAVLDADRLLTALLDDRGYPTGNHEERAEALSVRHARTLGHYRTAHDTIERHGRGQASTEDLRDAMVHYRAMIEELLDDQPARAPR